MFYMNHFKMKCTGCLGTLNKERMNFFYIDAFNVTKYNFKSSINFHFNSSSVPGDAIHKFNERHTATV